MAIEINLNKKRKTPLWITISAVIIGVVILAFVGTYFYFYFVNKKMASKIEEIDNSIIPLGEAIEEKEEMLVLQRQKINDFEVLLSTHKKVENTFKFLEKNTLPVIWFADFKLDQTEGQNSILLEGKSPSFLTVEQQLNIFSIQKEVKKAELNDISITEEGEIKFTIEIVFNPAIFNHNFYEYEND